MTDRLFAPLARFSGASPPAPVWFSKAIAQTPERIFLPVLDAGIEVLVWGKVGRPGLLFLHGSGANADWWSWIAPSFAAERRVAALSWSGMGRSDWREAYDCPTYAQEMLATILAAELASSGSPPVVIAHSYGAMPAMYFAAHWPDALSGLILVDAAIQHPKTTHGPWLKGEGPHPVYPTLADALANFRLQPPQPHAHPYALDYAARHGLKRVSSDGEEGWTWRFDPFLRPKTHRLSAVDLLSRVKSPPTLVYGERSRFNPHQNSDDATADAGRSDLRHIWIAGASHHIMFDQPLALTRALRQVLDGR